MIRTYYRYLYQKFSAYLDAKTEDIDHKSIIRDVTARADVSGSYLISIVLANLIALLGLLVNSIAVVIGAMLISPLMGPIFSTALSFSIGDLKLGRTALRNIAASIALTVVMAAILTVLSPLKEVTHEILVRTRPNIYDLLIAFFAGTAGAIALCTRKNYLFTTTGVAVATAVIPPLSVVGYGIGTWQWSIAMGGFLLFFTNFVAIVLSSDLVFYILRFRASMVEESPYPLRRRIRIMALLLIFLSIPLVYTLVVDIRKARIAKGIESILKDHLNRADHSRLTGFTESSSGIEGVRILASINTVKYFENDVEQEIERALGKVLGKPVELDLEQVIVRSGQIRPDLQSVGTMASKSPGYPKGENLDQLREKVMRKVWEGCSNLEEFLRPFPVQDCSVTFAKSDGGVNLTLKIARDYPFSDQEKRWMQLVLEKKLKIPLHLKVEAVPFLPPVVFDEHDKISPDSRNALALIKKLQGKSDFRLVIETPSGKKSRYSQKRKIEVVRQYLTDDLGVAKKDILLQTGEVEQINVRIREN